MEQLAHGDVAPRHKHIQAYLARGPAVDSVSVLFGEIIWAKQLLDGCPTGRRDLAVEKSRTHIVISSFVRCLRKAPGV
jgi:hypothetical protein